MIRYRFSPALLQLRRKGLSVSQRAFARDIGIGQTTYREYELGRYTPTSERLLLICDRLGINDPRMLFMATEFNYETEGNGS